MYVDVIHVKQTR